MNKKEEKCEPCTIVTCLGVTLRICKKTGKNNQQKCIMIQKKVQNRLDNIKKKEVKQIINQVRKMTKNKKHLKALDEVEKFLEEPEKYE